MRSQLLLKKHLIWEGTILSYAVSLLFEYCNSTKYDQLWIVKQTLDSCRQAITEHIHKLYQCTLQLIRLLCMLYDWSNHSYVRYLPICGCLYISGSQSTGQTVLTDVFCLGPVILTPPSDWPSDIEAGMHGWSQLNAHTTILRSQPRLQLIATPGSQPAINSFLLSNYGTLSHTLNKVWIVCLYVFHTSICQGNK